MNDWAEYYIRKALYTNPAEKAMAGKGKIPPSPLAAGRSFSFHTQKVYICKYYNIIAIFRKMFTI